MKASKLKTLLKHTHILNRNNTNTTKEREIDYGKKEKKKKLEPK